MHHLRSICASLHAVKYYDQESGPRHGYGLWTPRCKCPPSALYIRRRGPSPGLIFYCMAVLCECWLGGGNDGPDDGAENGLNWTLAHMLGADEKVLEMWRIGWEGHLRQ